MNISGIRPITGSEIYNSIQKSETDVADAASLQKPGQTAEETKEYADEASVREQQTFNAVSYAKQYEPGLSFDMKGADSDLMKLDVEKAISDMQKDQVLVQYQFFVGEKIEQGRVTANTPQKNPLFREDENFDI